MGDPLRDRRPLEDWVAESQVIEFTEELGAFERLADAAKSDLAALGDEVDRQELREYRVSGWIQFDLTSAHAGRPCVTGQIEAAVPVVCQRCLTAFPLSVNAELRYELLVPQTSGVKRKVTEGDDAFEPWELDEGLVRPIDIVDEALVMALPLVAKHGDRDDCVEFDAEPDGKEKTLPFASLREQMDEVNED